MQQITQEQRYTISRMLNSGYSVETISKAIGKDNTSVYRELKRNSDKRSKEYRPDLAQRKSVKRHKEKPKKIKFTKAIQEEVENLLREDYSPEQIVGFLKKEGKSTVSIERIYQHIWKDKKNGGILYLHLRREGRKYNKRGSNQTSRGIIKGRIGIEKRPKIVEEKIRFGDLEVDLIIGKDHKQAIVTINDRASGMLKMQKLNSKKSEEVSRAIVSMLEDWKPYIKTITSDNGKEFANHQFITENIDISYYFATPYHSWERGANENLNGLVRQYFKKGSSFSWITNEDIKAVETKLNNRPRKRFNYETPIFVMNNLLFNKKLRL